MPIQYSMHVSPQLKKKSFIKQEIFFLTDINLCCQNLGKWSLCVNLVHHFASRLHNKFEDLPPSSSIPRYHFLGKLFQLYQKHTYI